MAVAYDLVENALLRDEVALLLSQEVVLVEPPLAGLLGPFLRLGSATHHTLTSVPLTPNPCAPPGATYHRVSVL